MDTMLTTIQEAVFRIVPVPIRPIKIPVRCHVLLSVLLDILVTTRSTLIKNVSLRVPVGGSLIIRPGLVLKHAPHTPHITLIRRVALA